MLFTRKKVLSIALLLLVTYLVGGIGLIAVGIIDKLYFWPGWSVKGPNAGKDRSGFSADGPLVFYRGGFLLSKRIAPHKGGLALVADTLRPTDTLTCYVDETKQTFRVPLRVGAVVSAAVYPVPEKLLAISDIEGNFKGLESLLRGVGVVDEQLAWAFGRGHLVLVGDFFDRGLNVTECLWLVYKLEQEAERAGGKVHFIMGNHERMNLTGQLRYLRRKYRVNADTLGVPYMRWYDRSTVLGRWLRTKNAVEKIGTYAMCHGGVSPQLAESGLTMGDINKISRQYLGTTLDKISNSEARIVFDYSTGIFWYRGMAKNQLDKQEVGRLLHYIGAKRVVIGHTLQSDLTALYSGRVICVDLYHEENLRQGFMKTLWIEDGLCYGLDSRGEKSSVFTISSTRRSSTNNEDD